MKIAVATFIDNFLARYFRIWNDMRRWPICSQCHTRMLPYRPRSMFTCTACHEGISYEAVSDLQKQEKKDRERSATIRRANPWRPGEHAPSFRSSANY